MNLDGLTFRVSSTAANGVIDQETRLRFRQRGTRVLGHYAGGSVRRGCLVGTLTGACLRFRYAQSERDAHVHAGHSTCDIEILTDGRLRLFEHFIWETRVGSGINVFEQVGSTAT